jgi:hypothetical protein
MDGLPHRPEPLLGAMQFPTRRDSEIGEREGGALRPNVASGFETYNKGERRGPRPSSFIDNSQIWHFEGPGVEPRNTEFLLRVSR